MKNIVNVFVGLIGCLLFAQQVPDLDYNPKIINPAYTQGKGTIVYIDEAHHNFHTRTGRYAPFAQLLEKDGYVTK